MEYDNKDYGLKFSQNIQSDCNVIGAVACCNHIKKLLIFGQSVSENYNQTTDIHGFIQNLAHEDSHATIRKVDGQMDTTKLKIKIVTMFQMNGNPLKKELIMISILRSFVTYLAQVHNIKLNVQIKL